MRTSNRLFSRHLSMTGSLRGVDSTERGHSLGKAGGDVKHVFFLLRLVIITFFYSLQQTWKEQKQNRVDLSVLFQVCLHSYLKTRRGIKVPCGLAASLNAPEEECFGPKSPVTSVILFRCSSIQAPLTSLYVE